MVMVIVASRLSTVEDFILNKRRCMLIDVDVQCDELDKFLLDFDTNVVLLILLS
jgi:hypothetical protein